MRVALLCRGDLFPTVHGAAVKIVRTAEALAARGDHVVVVTEDRAQYWQVTARGWEARPYGPGLRRALDRLYAPAWVDRACARVGYPVEEWLLYRPVFDPDWWARALYVGVRERIEVYQAEFPGYAVPAAIAAKVLGGRSFLSEHNAEFDRLARTTGLSPSMIQRLRRLEASFAAMVDRVLVVSQEDRGRLVEAGVAPRRIRVVPLGVETSAFFAPPLDLRARYGLGPLPILFFHGTLHYAPNADAVRFLAESLAPALDGAAQIVVAGVSPPRALSRNNLHFVGPVEDLAGHILGVDLALCPITSGGGTRMKLLEYFAAARPVISAPFGAEGLGAVHDEHLVMAELPEFEREIRALLADPARGRRLGDSARRLAFGRDWRAIADATRALHAGGDADFVPRPAADVHLPPRTPSKPLTLLLLVNRGCNLRCSFCDLWEQHVQMPLDRVRRLLDDAAQIGTRTLVLTGGEPLLHPGLPRIIAEARSRGFGVNVTTNGTLLLRHLSALEAAGVNSVSISLDGLPATHDRLRGQPGAFARSWEALVRVVHDGRIGVSVYFVVTRENVRELVPTFERVRALGAGFDFWPVNDAPDLYLRPEDHAAWLDAVAHIARHDREVAARRGYYAEALPYHAGERGPVRCLGLVDQYGVNVEGDLLPCCVWGGEGLKVGNVFETPLPALWASPEVRAHREHLFHQGCTAGCYNHSLYEFAVSTGLSHRVGPASPALPVVPTG